MIQLDLAFTRLLSMCMFAAHCTAIRGVQNNFDYYLHLDWRNHLWDSQTADKNRSLIESMRHLEGRSSWKRSKTVCRYCNGLTDGQVIVEKLLNIQSFPAPHFRERGGSRKIGFPPHLLYILLDGFEVRS